MAGAVAEFDTLRSIAFGSISGSYANIGTSLDTQCTLFKIANNTDGDVIISTNGGVTDHIFVAAGSFSLYDIRSNRKTIHQDNYVLPIGTQFAIKQVTAPTEGNVYVEVLM